MKVRTSLRKICENCKLVKRGKKNLVICSTTPKHKQRQGYSTVANVRVEAEQLAARPATLGTSLRAMSFAQALSLLFPELVIDDL